jgi:hypothetical protein
VGGCERVFWVRDGVEVAGGHAGFEDEVAVRFGDAMTVVDDREGSIAAVLQGRGHENAGSAGVAGVTDQFQEGVFHMGDA